MSTPIALGVDITISLEAREGGCVISALNHGTEIARGTGATVQEAVPALVSFFADLQRAAIEALYATGIVGRGDGSDEEAPAPGALAS